MDNSNHVYVTDHICLNTNPPERIIPAVFPSDEYDSSFILCI